MISTHTFDFAALAGDVRRVAAERGLLPAALCAEAGITPDIASRFLRGLRGLSADSLVSLAVVAGLDPMSYAVPRTTTEEHTTCPTVSSPSAWERHP